MDLVMPGGIDGRELAIKARALGPDLPVVFLSGYPAPREGGKAFSWESLGTKVLAKPLRKSGPGERINQSLRERASAG